MQRQSLAHFKSLGLTIGRGNRLGTKTADYLRTARGKCFDTTWSYCPIRCAIRAPLASGGLRRPAAVEPEQPRPPILEQGGAL
ncbi:BQ5605_C010g05971 [Microbotryum silenes-dioicae]|uniref:BQ5605_C010g05971 protein n=1 Tax=Microbotryum silenes-dioicae TaxID=796604 RepID=A0A2X0NM97_9BASI|nr:BQ5605_C010g05971 [Microbotryum silenes-dioicae]